MFEAYTKIAIAFSGGTDSTLLAALAVRELGADSVLCLHAVLPTGIPRERDFANEFVRETGCGFLEIHVDILSEPKVAENGPLRCYYCKKKIFTELLKHARQFGFPVLADGTNADDDSDWRPGRKAADELGVIHPFLDAGFNKQKIRETASELGLANAWAPASACMASRIPTGTPLDPVVLRKCLHAEEIMHAAGFPGTRARALSADHLRLEFPESVPENAEALHALCRDCGFQTIESGLYQRGSMNRH